MNQYDGPAAYLNCRALCYQNSLWEVLEGVNCPAIKVLCGGGHAALFHLGRQYADEHGIND